MSFHNHTTGFTHQMLESLDKAGLEDETVARSYPKVPSDPAEFFHHWITQGELPGHEDGSPGISFFQLERSWWEARTRPNVLLVHYNDLKADLSGEMHRVADFLGISIPERLWPELVDAAGFEAMKRKGEVLVAKVATSLQGGSQRFFFCAKNERWRRIVSDEDLARYDAKVEALLSESCGRWLEKGRLLAGEPRTAVD